jgi:hypothetical protein
VVAVEASMVVLAAVMEAGTRAVMEAGIGKPLPLAGAFVLTGKYAFKLESNFFISPK